MLIVKNINIKFNRTIIENSRLHIFPHQITVLCGESGSGKSSLLNVLGLLDETNQYEYIWIDKIIDKKDYNEFKRTQISYVFQDYNMIDDLSIMDNFKVMFNIAGLKYSKERMLELLNQVSIDASKIKQKSKSLSGGEKQRVSIALALVKQPKLLLLDEPTANLDEENAKIIVKILHELKMQGLMIVIASHHPHLYEADHIYTIQNETLIETITSEAKKEMIVKEEKRKQFNPFAYAYTNITKHLVIYLLMAIAITFPMQNILETSYWVTNVLMDSEKITNSLIDTDIYVKNNERYVTARDKNSYNGNGVSFSEEKIHKIKEIDHVENVYLYHSYSTTNGNAYTLDGKYTHEKLELNTISSGDKTINTTESEWWFDNVSTVVCNKDKMINKCIEVDKSVENGVFIPQALAIELDINELNQTKISFNMAVSIGFSEYRNQVVLENNQLGEEILIDSENFVITPVTYEVQGIYENTIDTNHSIGGVGIYIDHNEYENVQNKLLKENDFEIIFKNDINWSKSEGLRYGYGNYSSVVIVEVDDYKNSEKVANTIEETIDDVYIKTSSTTKDIIKEQDKEMLIGYLLQPFILGIVAIILIALLYVYILRHRRKEFAFIKAHGIKTIQNTSLIDMAYLFVFSTPFIAIGVAPVILQYFSFPSLIRNRYIMILIFIIILGILIFASIIGICYLVCKWYFKKHDVIKELRSK